MFERFTERARQVVVLAQDEARVLKHNYIGTEHILLGLLREEEGLAARALDALDIGLEEVQAQVARIVGLGDEQVVAGQIPFTPRAKKVLELALREALSLGDNYIGTEHVLLGLVSENEGVGARILLDFNADAERVRNEVIRLVSGPGGSSATQRIRRRRPPTGAQFAIAQGGRQLTIACPNCGAALETITTVGAGVEQAISRSAQVPGCECQGCGETWTISYQVTWKRQGSEDQPAEPGGEPSG
jgi:ATP-dependent Clp protease ATP-binding subunit ClpC